MQMLQAGQIDYVITINPGNEYAVFEVLGQRGYVLARNEPTARFTGTQTGLQDAIDYIERKKGGK